MAQAKTTDKRRSGQLTTESVEVWTDEDYARATGLFQILDEGGHAEAAQVPKLAPAALLRMFEGMLMSRMLDEQLLPLQRQGRISHYFEARGQEAGPIAGAEAMVKTDYFVQGLREGAAAPYRGLPLTKYIAQILGTSHDAGRGRQMPCHVGSAAIRHVSTSSAVASQIPHAVGIAMAAKIRKEDTVSLCYFGDGATSEDDFHAGLNFAGVYKAPVVLAWAIPDHPWVVNGAAVRIAMIPAAGARVAKLLQVRIGSLALRDRKSWKAIALETKVDRAAGSQLAGVADSLQPGRRCTGACVLSARARRGRSQKLTARNRPGR